MSDVGHQQKSTTTDEGIAVDEVDLEAHSVTGDRAPLARRYVIRVDSDRLHVSVPEMPGEAILELVEKCSTSHFLDQRLRGGGMREVGADDVVDFRAPGVERFETAFKLCIEGKFYRWLEPTITPEQIAELGGWNISEGVVQIDVNQNEVTLSPNQVVTLGPGCSFGKKIRWKRGSRMMTPRIAEELALLRLHYTVVDHVEANSLHWFRAMPVRMPENCSPDRTEVAFAVTQGYPGAEPYGFFIPRALTVNGAAPSEHGAPHPPPFPGEWRFLSWSPVDWRPTADVQTGSNVWAWLRTFAQRLREGQ